jgi:hypothetical protein
MFIYTHCWELMNSMVSHGSSSLPFVMKVMVYHFVNNSHEVMTAFIVVLLLIVVDTHQMCYDLMYIKLHEHI